MASLKYTKGMPNSYLKTTVKKVDGSSALISQASKSASSAKKDPVSASAAQKDLLLAIHQMVEDSKTQSLDLNARTCDVILDKISQWLEQVNDNLTSDEDIEKVKEAIIDEINSASFSKILSAVLVSQVTSLFDDNAKREDIEELKGYIAGLVKESGGSEGSESNGEQSGITYSSKEVSSTADEEAGDYRDSTVAANFSTLQQFVESQVNMLNENIKSIPGGIGFGKIGKLLGAGFAGVLSATKKLGSKIGSLAKGTFSKLASVTKIIGGGILKGIGKTLSGIVGGVASIGKGIGKLGSGIFKGISSIGSAVKGFGAKVGGAIAHPFKAIGGFFKNRKKDKAEAKKEKLREKFMDFMMKMFEKLWDFLEPILSKLKIFMLITMVPILVVAVKVLLILAAITAIVVGIVLAVMWVKNKLIPKIKALLGKLKAWAIEKWESFKKWLSELWDGIKAVGTAVWDFTKYIFTDMWVDLGKWIWEKLVQFGQWVKKTLIDPVVNWIRENIVTPIVNFYKDKIQPHIQPYIDSVKNLIARVKQAFSAWDTSKSIWDNLKNIAGIIKQAVMEWWETSPFKKAYDSVVAPVIDSVKNLVQRLKDIWQKFSWDEDKTFIQNLMAFWDSVKASIIEWWNGSPIKTYWEKITSWFSDLWGKIKEKWNESAIGKWINGVVQKIGNLVKAAARVYIKIPVWNKNIYPFAFLTGAPFLVDGSGDKNAEAAEKEQERNARIAELKADLAKDNYWTDRGKRKDQEELARLLAEQKAAQQQSIAQQQVSNAIGTVSSINGMNAQNNAELQKTGAEMSSKAEAAQRAAEDYRQQQALIGSQSLSRFDDLEKKLDKYGNDPAVVPMPIPYGPQRNAAMMEHY